jgi:hypothetical protein
MFYTDPLLGFSGPRVMNCSDNFLCLNDLRQGFPKSAPRTTGGPRDELKWPANPYTNQYFVLRGALEYFKWSALQKSLGTTDQ